MRINTERTKVIMAKKRIMPADIKTLSLPTVYSALQGKDVNIKTIWKFADELGVDVEEILERCE